MHRVSAECVSMAESEDTMCKATRIINVKTARGISMVQVNLPLNLELEKADEFAADLQALADEATVEDGKVKKKVVSLIDNAVKVYAVSLGIVSIDRKNMCGRAVTNAELVSEAALYGDKKAAREDLKKAVDGMFSGIDWKVENRHINMMTSVKTDRNDRVNRRGTQTGNVERSGRVDVRAWCDTVRSMTQCKTHFDRVFD